MPPRHEPGATNAVSQKPGGTRCGALRSVEEKVIPARSRELVATGLTIAIPEGTYARVAPRSGLAVKHCIDTGAGVIDEDYRGHVQVVLINNSEQEYTGGLAVSVSSGSGLKSGRILYAQLRET